MSVRGKILFLDLARRTGWALGEPGGALRSGSTALARDKAPLGELFTGLDAWLTAMIGDHRPGVVAFEQPMDPRHMGGKTTFHTVRLLIGLAAQAEATCFRLKVPHVFECSVSDVRKHVVGKVPRGGGKEAKKAVIGALRIQGFGKIRDDNEADAVAGWLYTEAVLSPSKGEQRLPLFQRTRRGDF